MADIAGLEPVSCGFKSRSPYPFMIGKDASAHVSARNHGRDAVSRFIGPAGHRALRPSPLLPMPTCHRASMPHENFQALSSAGQNSGLIIRESRVRIPQGQPL